MIRRSNLPSYLTQAEIRALFAAISNPRDRLLFALAYAYGLRVGEIVHLDRDDVDLERRRIRIQRLKGGLSGERPIFRSLLPLLKQYLESRGNSTDAPLRGPSGPPQDAADPGSLPPLRNRSRVTCLPPPCSRPSPFHGRPPPRLGRTMAECCVSTSNIVGAGGNLHAVATQIGMYLAVLKVPRIVCHKKLRRGHEAVPAPSSR